MADDHHYMQLALDACREGVARGQSPFGACIVRDGQVLATAHNTVWHDTDPTAHAEVLCLRWACQAVGEVHLAGATLYSTTEPCPMCFSAAHWAQVSRIVFGARVTDAASFGFNELPITNATMVSLTDSPVELVGDFRRADALALYRQWRDQGGRAY